MMFRLFDGFKNVFTTKRRQEKKELSLLYVHQYRE